MSKKLRTWLLPTLLTLVSILVIGASLSLRYLDLDTYKEQIVAQVRSALKRDIRYSSGDFSFRFGPSFTFYDIVIKEKNGVDDFVKADRLTLRIALLPLLRQEFVLARMQLARPVLQLSRDRDGVFNIADLLTPAAPPTPAAAPPSIGAIQLENAQVRFTDLAVAPTPVVTELSNTDLYLSRLTRGKDCDFEVKGSLMAGARKVPLLLAGVAKLPKAGAPWSGCQITGRVRTGGLDTAHFWPYYGRFLPFQNLAGLVSLEATFKGRPTAFKSKAEVGITGLNLDYPKVFHARLTPKSVKASCEIELNDKKLEFDHVKLNVDGLAVQGSCRLSDLHGKDMRITAKATTNRFNLREYRQFIPYGIIVKDTADFIEQKVTGGFYRLEDGRLDGTVSQILHMERGHNYDILYVKAHVEEGVVAYGNGFPVCSDIKGELYLAGKDFILKGMHGTFGSSPMALEGRITDYPLDTPCRYLFTANVRAKQQEAAWVLGKQRDRRFHFGDGALLRVTGEGGTSAYNVTAAGDLTPVAYTLPELISKPQGRPNAVSVKVTFGKQDFRITALNYSLSSLALSATSVSGYDGPVSLDLKTNQFQCGDIAPLTPALARFHPAGKLQAQLHGSGPGLDRLSWSGTVGFAGVSLKAADKVRPLSDINGTLKVGGENLESSQFTAKVGSSTISGHGTLSGLKSPVVTLVFTSPALDLADLGLTGGRGPLHIDRVQGSVSFNKERDYLQISALSGTIGHSTMQLKGVLQELQHPRMDLAVTASHLELEDITPLFGSSGGGSGTGASSTGAAGGPTLNGKIHLFAAEGKAKDIPFQRLRTVVMLEENILYLQPLECSTAEGDLTGKVRIDFGSGATRYQASWNLERASAEKVAHMLGVKKQEITGTLTLRGDLTAKGDSSADWKRTALGAVSLKIEHGTLKQFATLSKIFSILNVSQLFKLKLPDMVSGGMPYNKITGDFAVRDGALSTQNLFLDSNAMNLSAVGKLDMVRDELDLKIGVQPLQTVDKVVSRIPIVGWILTGKEHSLVTTYFEAKGKIEDPQVKAIPVKTLAKGVLNIFKRVFELPGRLITDTGEVMIGN
ncbi:AsmA-like C-terminal domain-containing protein [Geomonas sp.]|uniref:YhdP family protein n=1 Tax=Geomonas sp. TaxID=2651584 RepID=UPI002B460CC7|nr:AsmA-like C-terminal domain-containing protein [Geomonas sp.]HJV35895.1 AsmA-like C-terminal domain-containing protein [Geomonas sp.]